MATKEWLDKILTAIENIFNGDGDHKDIKEEAAQLRVDLNEAVAALAANDLSDKSREKEAAETAERLQAAIDAMVTKLTEAPPEA